MIDFLISTPGIMTFLNIIMIALAFFPIMILVLWYFNLPVLKVFHIEHTAMQMFITSTVFVLVASVFVLCVAGYDPQKLLFIYLSYFWLVGGVGLFVGFLELLEFLWKYRENKILNKD